MLESLTKLWSDITIRKRQDAFRAGLMVALKGEHLRGPRYVVLHAGSVQGFIRNAKYLFFPQKNLWTTMVLSLIHI